MHLVFQSKRDEWKGHFLFLQGPYKKNRKDLFGNNCVGNNYSNSDFDFE